MRVNLNEKLDNIIDSLKNDFDFDVNEMAEDLIEFMKEKLNFNRDPKIFFEDSSANAYNILGKTGYYDPQNGEVHIFITKRHPKDVLRSLAHELIHHSQACDGKMSGDKIASASDENYILHDDYLKEMERDAFERGNLIFREWEANKKIQIKEAINEVFNESKKKKKKRKLTTKKYNKAKKIATSLEKKQGYSAEKAHKIAFAQVQKEGMDKNMADEKEKKEVEVNDVLKNSHVYNAEDRKLYEKRDEIIYQELLKKFGIKK